jgi:uncharacterized protein
VTDRTFRPFLVFVSSLRFFAASAVLIVLVAGCRKARAPSATEIHAITSDFLSAIKSATPPASEVQVDSHLSAASRQKNSIDYVDVRIRAESESSARKTITQLLQALNSVATKHHLSRKGPLESREGLLYAFSRDGMTTHKIHFHESTVFAAKDQDEARREANARLAIILDDLGNDRAAAEAIFALSCPITLSVLPNHPHSVEIAEEAHRRGYEVMLHLPMQSVGHQKPESQELHPGMAGVDVASLVDELLRAVPAATGVNNHQGSQSTADARLMDELMPVLREHHLFYVDSRTTAATIAYDTAQRFGVRSGFRNTPFLDDVEQVAPIRKQLQLAMRNARAKGAAIAIGHPHSATLQALKEVLPEANTHGVRLVFVSEVVH